MRRFAALGVIGVALTAPAVARASTVALDVDKHVARHHATVTFTGKLEPATGGQRVQLYRVLSSSVARVGTPVKTRANGTFTKAISIGRPGKFFMRVTVAGPPVEHVDSNRVTVRVRPGLRTHFSGSPTIGEKLYLVGKLTPRAAGVLKKTVRGATYTVRMTSTGRFKIKLPTNSARRVRVRLHLVPAAGYEPATRIRSRAMRLPSLSIGSRSAAVRILERTLRGQHYALPTVNSRYGLTTAEAVYAFQGVHDLARTGRVGASFWRLLSRVGVPKARAPRGSHIEISKTDGTVYEVRKGEVVNVLHTSTGATGNTPVGTFHVYSKVPGYNAKEMYYSLFFLRGFAIHGYHSVPAYPASHGCARIPIWAAHGLYDRWGIGTTVKVFG